MVLSGESSIQIGTITAVVHFEKAVEDDEEFL